jgi:hypothetical protein
MPNANPDDEIAMNSKARSTNTDFLNAGQSVKVHGQMSSQARPLIPLSILTVEYIFSVAILTGQCDDVRFQLRHRS